MTDNGAGTGKARPGTGPRVLLFLATLAGSWILLFLGFPPGAPDRLPVLAIAVGLALWTAGRPDQGIVAFCFLFPCTGLLVRLFGGTDPSTWPALLLGGLATGWTFRFIYDFESRSDPSAIDRWLRALLAVWCVATALAVFRARTLWAIAHGLAGRAVNTEGLLDAEAVRESVFALSSLVAGAALFFVARRAGPRVRARALSAGLWGVTASALAAGLQRVGMLPPETRGFWKLTGRLGGGAVDPNSLGILCALALIVALASFRESLRGALRIVRAAVLVLGLALSGSRSGFLLLVLALVLLLAARGVTPRVRIAGLVALAATLILVLLLVLRGDPGTIGGRLAESFDPKLPIAYRVSERPALWRAAIRLFQSHPVAGAGMGAFEWRLPDLMREENRRLPTRDNPGSAYIQALAETGVLGFLVTIGFVWSLASQLLGGSRTQSDRPAADAAGAGLVAFLITLALGSHWFAPDVSLLFFLIAATAVAPARSEERVLRSIRRAAVWLYAVAAVAGILGTVRPEETFRYSPRIGFHPAEAGPHGPLRWTRRSFALWLKPGERVLLQLAHFTPEAKPVDVVAAVSGTEVWRRSLVPGETAHLVLSGPHARAEAVVFRLSRSFVPRRLRLSEDRRELGLLSAEE